MHVDLMQCVWRSEMKWRQSDGGHKCSACCQHLNIIGPVRVRSHPSAHAQTEYMITDQAFFFFLQELKPPRLSSDSLLTILTASLDVIAATYECTPPHINLSMSSS